VPLLGSALSILGNPNPFLLEQYRRLGPIFRLHAVHHRFTVLAGPEANALFSRSADKHLHAEPSWRAFNTNFGATCVAPGIDGPPHHRVRKMLQRGYSRGAILRRLPEAVAIARRVLDRFAPGPVALVPLCRAIVTEQLGTLVLGRGPGEYLDDLSRNIRFALNCLVTRQWPAAMLRLPAYQRARRRFFEFADAILAARGKPGAPNSDLLDDMQAFVDADPSALSEADKQMVAMGPFIAGLDTVANTVAFLMYALLREPAVLGRVEADAHALLADPGSLSGERLAEARAVNGAVQETLRLYPIAPLIFRHVAAPFDFGGYHVPSGEPVLFATTMVHHMPEYFPDPLRFDIDRYERPARRGAAICSFGLGPHTCLGSGFAEVQMQVIAAALLHYARFTLEPGARPPRIRQDPTLTLGNRYKVRLAELR